MSNCTDDSECPDPLVCYLSPQWSLERNFCDCESWYGWSGSNCLSLSSGSAILLASASISGILALIALLLSLDQLVRTCRKLRSSHTRVNTGAVTLTLLVISLLSLLSWRINLLTIVLTPEDNTLNANSNGAVSKVHQRLVIERVFVGITVLSLCCALLEVSLVWLELAEGSLSTESIVRARKYRYVITSFQLFWVLLYVVCAVLGEIALMTFLTLPILFFLMLAYCGARRLMYRKFAPMIERDAAAEDTLKGTVNAISRTSKRIFFAGIFTIFGAGMYVLLTLIWNYRDIVGTGDWVNVAALFAEFVPWGVVASSYALLANLYDTKAEGSIVYKFKMCTRAATRATSLTSRSDTRSKSKTSDVGQPRVEEVTESVNGVTI